MVQTTTQPTIVSDRRAGPPGCGNGGWVSGLLAERLDDLAPGEGGPTTVTVRLTAPTPLEQPLRWEVDGSVDDPGAVAVHLLHEETLLGTARRARAPELDVPAPVSLEEALEAFDRRRLAGAVRTEDAGDLPAVGSPRGPVDGNDITEDAAQVLHDNGTSHEI